MYRPPLGIRYLEKDRQPISGPTTGVRLKRTCWRANGWLCAWGEKQPESISGTNRTEQSNLPSPRDQRSQTGSQQHQRARLGNR
jgi:hypothetical protein